MAKRLNYAPLNEGMWDFDLYFTGDTVRIRDEAREAFPNLKDENFYVLSDPFVGTSVLVSDGNGNEYRGDLALFAKV